MKKPLELSTSTMRMALLMALAAIDNSTTSRGAGMAPAPLEPARRGKHNHTARHPWVALHKSQFTIHCWVAAAAAATTFLDAMAVENAYGQSEPRRQSAAEDKAPRATPRRAVRAPRGRGLSPNWGGAYQQTTPGAPCSASRDPGCRQSNRTEHPNTKVPGLNARIEVLCPPPPCTTAPPC